MRENRTYGSEGGGTGKPVLPTPIGCLHPSLRYGNCQRNTTTLRVRLSLTYLCSFATALI